MGANVVDVPAEMEEVLFLVGKQPFSYFSEGTNWREDRSRGPEV